MSGISLTTKTPTFSQIEQHFAPDDFGKSKGDHNLNFQATKGLYTNDKFSAEGLKAGLKASVGFFDALVSRYEKRIEGFNFVKKSIDREYPGMGAKVLRDLGIKDLEGIKQSDLGRIRDYLNNFESKCETAVKDPALSSLEKTINQSRDPKQLTSFLGAHYEVCSSSIFWQNQIARDNTAVLGLALGISVLERIQANGFASKADIADLNKALSPFERDDFRKADQIPEQSGPCDDAQLGALAQKVFDRYVGPGAPLPLKLTQAGPTDQAIEQGDALERFEAHQTGADALAHLNDLLKTSLSKQTLPDDFLSAPLKAAI